jgi:hypothetical protein
MAARPPSASPTDVAVEVVDVGRPATTKLTVDDVAVSGTDIREGSTAVVAAGLLNAGALSVRGVRVRLVLEGPQRIEQTQSVTIAGRLRQVLRFDGAADPGRNLSGIR